MTEVTEVKRKNGKKAIAVGALGAALLIPSMFAYFTDNDSETNEFTVGKIGIDLIEENWTASNATAITPEQEFAKDPKVTVDADSNEAYVFVKVDVPCANVKTASETGAVQDAAKTQLFSYNVNPGWELVETVEKADVNTYVYGYVGSNGSGNNTDMLAVAANQSTDTVFDHIKFANVIEDQNLEGTTQQVQVSAYAIQTLNVNDGKTSDLDGNNDDGTKAPAEVWSVVKTQQNVAM